MKISKISEVNYVQVSWNLNLLISPLNSDKFIMGIKIKIKYRGNKLEQIENAFFHHKDNSYYFDVFDYDIATLDLSYSSNKVQENSLISPEKMLKDPNFSDLQKH
ncbi:hypothetical protein BpHYR1_024942 [Brachionus plicatilis]|uniref:Uncharacterized protein n=1 Tax=Brachionus plicatilis TaxID=10195 RepID=A0A3M7PF69_BRAPC|nr:hypothetical protein BpHYR1_024942 [Brachionus plicatilis]